MKDSLHRLARSARTRGVAGAGAGRSGDSSGAHGQGVGEGADKAQSLVDRCVANLLYHRYTDSPGPGPGGSGAGSGSGSGMAAGAYTRPLLSST